MTLTEFLLARIAEDEAVILNGWDSDGRARIATMWTGGEPGYTTVASDHADGPWVADGHEVENPRHVRVLFDPARVLAECEAKRQLVQECAAFRGVADATAGDAPLPQALAQAGVVQGLERAVAHLASVYVDHPDYQPEWKP